MDDGAKTAGTVVINFNVPTDERQVGRDLLRSQRAAERRFGPRSSPWEPADLHATPSKLRKMVKAFGRLCAAVTGRVRRSKTHD